VIGASPLTASTWTLAGHALTDELILNFLEAEHLVE
jgi:hypothetical protein